MAGKVDVLVWITDPEKYADSIIHDHFIRPRLAQRGDPGGAQQVRQAQRARPEGRRRFLEQLLREDGLKKSPSFPPPRRPVTALRTCAAPSPGSPPPTAQTARIEADLATVTAPWAGQKPSGRCPPPRNAGWTSCLPTPPAPTASPPSPPPPTANASARRPEWLLTSWMLRLRADPLRRLGLREEADETGVHRSSSRRWTPPGVRWPTGVCRATPPTSPRVCPTAGPARSSTGPETIVDELPEELDQAAARTNCPPSRQAPGACSPSSSGWPCSRRSSVSPGTCWPRSVPGALSPLLDDIIPEIEGWPIPTLLILGGLLLGILLGLFTGVFGVAIGSGVKRRTRRALRREVSEISAAEVVEPLSEIRSRYARFLARIHVAAGIR
ncbi:ABC transporter [Corynebacterium suedekumii]|nr:ABC transporter [Corynebacterium suedekumii]